jgi:carbon monoxide dehydrogenase subunit G
MKASGEYRVTAARELVWSALNDAEVLRSCIPGCTSFERQSELQYEATVVTQLGPIKGSAVARIVLFDLCPPGRYCLKVEGRSGLAAFCQGGATVVLKDEGATTLLSYTAEFSLAGRLAAVGSRLAEMAVQKVAEDFFQAFAKHFAASTSGGTVADGLSSTSNLEPETVEATAVIRPRGAWTVHLGPAGIFARFRRRRARGVARLLERHLGVLAVSLGGSVACALDQSGIAHRIIRATLQSKALCDPLPTSGPPSVSADLIVECGLSEDALRTFYLERIRNSWLSRLANELTICDVRVRVLSCTVPVV